MTDTNLKSKFNNDIVVPKAPNQYVCCAEQWEKEHIIFYIFIKCLSLCKFGWIYIFGRHSWDVPTPLSNIFKFLLCLSVCKLTYFLLKLVKSSNVSSSGWDIPGMFLHHFQIFSNFLYVSQSVSWLTFLLKLDEYKDISISGWYIFLTCFWDIPRIFLDYFQIIMNFL